MGGAAEDAGGPAEEGQIPLQCTPAFEGFRIGCILLVLNIQLARSMVQTGSRAKQIRQETAEVVGLCDPRRIQGQGVASPRGSVLLVRVWRAPAVDSVHARGASLCAVHGCD